MSDVQTASVKYVFLDVVAFTVGRSVEAQSDIVAKLNEIVRGCLEGKAIPPDKMILIPTGDGMCIALIEIPKPFDIHLLLAIDILSAVAHNTATETDPMRKFAIRVGLNENVDNLITDINGRQNVAGAGINIAQRVMSFADGSQVLISHTVFETLKVRERYLRAFKEFTGLEKHGESITVFQFVDEKQTAIDRQPPSVFAPKAKAPSRLTQMEAFFIATSLKHQEFLVSKNNRGAFSYTATYLIFALATDAESKMTAPKYEVPTLITWRLDDTSIEDKFSYYDNQDFWLLANFNRSFRENRTAVFRGCFDDEDGIFVSERGRKRLEQEWPQIAALVLSSK